ncbi:organic hydroperoxide resistance protein [Streptomyces sp. NPDC005438]|uniref:organic hydroperoxide resistance protein n=1 Tax=Streptomyces sp. NPDC005438 TaxID=3156880 RepID=UPI0033B5BE27
MSPQQPIKELYVAEATARGGRDGRVTSDDGQLDLTVNTPREMGGSGQGTNPEQLFAAGYGACFHSAFHLVARRERVDVSGSTVTARVAIGQTDDGGYGLRVTLVTTVPGRDEEEVRPLVEAAHQVCPYSRATRGNIEVELRIG